MAVNDNTSINGAGTSHRPMRRAEREVTDPTEIHQMLMRCMSSASPQQMPMALLLFPSTSDMNGTPLRDIQQPSLPSGCIPQPKAAKSMLGTPIPRSRLNSTDRSVLPLGTLPVPIRWTMKASWRGALSTRCLIPTKKRHGLTCLMNHMAPGVPVEFKDEVVKRVAVWQVNISRLTTKQREAK